MDGWGICKLQKLTVLTKLPFFGKTARGTVNDRHLTGQEHETGATMQTIADRLDISVATVSRALRRVPGINAETRASVLQMAAQLGYRLQKSYRTGRLSKTALHHIGVLVETPLSNLPAPYMTGMSEASMSLNASLVVHYVRPEHCERILLPEFQPRAMQSGLLSGLVLVFRWPIDVVKELSNSFPTVSIMHQYRGVDIDVVGVDNQSGIDLLIQRLHEFGHRRIGFFGRCGDVHWATARFGAYVGTLSALGIEHRPDWGIPIDFDTLNDPRRPWDHFTGKAVEAVRQGVTAWVCATEPAAHQLYARLVAEGFRVPEDVSITGFHRPDSVDPSEVQLTSVTASYEDIGAAALKRLLYRIQNPSESVRAILFPCGLYPGETTAPPPGAAVSAEKVVG